MADIVPSFRLSHTGALKILNAALTEASGTPVSIVIVDPGGKSLSSVSMDGVGFMTQEAALKKARTAVSRGVASGGLKPEIAALLASAMQDFTNLIGGIPIQHEGHVIGAVGVSGAAPERDLIIAQAGLAGLQGPAPSIATSEERDFDPSREAQHRCPCCNFKTLPKRSENDMCPICYWEDDGQDEDTADRVFNGPNGSLSLRQAQENYRQFGAIEERFKINVRPPKAAEI